MRQVSPDQLVLPCAEPMVRDQSSARRRLATPAECLPIPDKSAIDLDRVKKILACGTSHALRILKRQLIAGYRLGDRGLWMVEYQSVVAFCDALCVRYHITPKRTAKNGMGRYRDEELLPFPMRDTMGVPEVSRALGRAPHTALKLITKGSLQAYRLTTDSSWRISRPSFEALIDKMKAEFAASVEAAAKNRAKGDAQI